MFRTEPTTVSSASTLLGAPNDWAVESQNLSPRLRQLFESLYTDYFWTVSIILLAFIPNAPQPTNTVPGATFQFVLPIERSARPCNCGTRQTATFAECHLTAARCRPSLQAVG